MIVVTGCAGFVGSNICQMLIDNGFDVYGMDDLSFGDARNVPDKVYWNHSDFKWYQPKDDILIHCATSNIIYAMTHPCETFKNNAENTIELFKKFSGKIIYLSTSSVYGSCEKLPTPEDAEIKTTNAYDSSKRIAELYLQSRGHYTTLRLSNVYGTNQRPENPYCGVLGKMIHSALTGELFHFYGEGLDTRDYTYIDDVLEAVYLAVVQGALNTEINIGTGVESSVKEIWYKLNLVPGIDIKVMRADTVEKRAIDRISRRKLDIRKAKELLEWSPKVSLLEGLEKTVQWQRTNL